MKLWFVIAFLAAQSVCGQNAPEGIRITTTATTTTRKPTTAKPTTTEIITTTQKATTTGITTRPTTTYMTEMSKTRMHTTSKDLITTERSKGNKPKKDGSKKEAKKLKRKAKDDLLDKSTNKRKKTKNELKDKRKKANENKKKVKDIKKKTREAKRKLKDAKKKTKKAKKKTKILLKQAKSKLKDLKKSIRRKFRLTDRAYMKEFLRNCTMLLRSMKSKKKKKRKSKFLFSQKNTTSEELPNGFEVVQTMNNFGKQVALQLNNERKRKRKRKEVLPISSNGIEMEVSVVETEGFKGYRFPDPESSLNVNDSVELPFNFFQKNTKENASIISIVYDAFYEMTKENDEGKPMLPFVNSKIVSTTVDPKPTQSLADPVEIILSHLQKPNGTKPECVFWQVNESNPESGRWSSEGCKVHKSNQTHTTCHCNHLTDFAVLFNLADTDSKKLSIVHRQALSIVGLVGCLISSICLMITVVVFIVLRKLLRSTRNLVHFNLAVALLVANILLLLSDKAFANWNFCVTVSLCLFYFYLSAFCWMLGEGIFIWIMVAKAFSENLKAWMYLCIGWGIPFLIVAVAFGILRYELFATEFCWLSVKKGAIWAFAGPVLFVIVVNFGILVKVLCTAIEHNSNEERLKVSARLTLLLLPILGLTWVFGLMSMNENTVAFQYLFTFFNSFQGIFIFLCYIFLNSEVKNEYQKWRAKKEYSQSFQMKTTSTSGGSGHRRSRFGTQNESGPMIW